MKNELTDSRHFSKEPNTSDHLKGRACNGCWYMTVITRRRWGVIKDLHGNDKSGWLWFEEYYCNRKGRVLKTAEIPKKCEGRRS